MEIEREGEGFFVFNFGVLVLQLVFRAKIVLELLICEFSIFL
jgi:hypothetical protein